MPRACTTTPFEPQHRSGPDSKAQEQETGKRLSLSLSLSLGCAPRCCGVAVGYCAVREIHTYISLHTNKTSTGLLTSHGSTFTNPVDREPLESYCSLPRPVTSLAAGHTRLRRAAAVIPVGCKGEAKQDICARHCQARQSTTDLHGQCLLGATRGRASGPRCFLLLPGDRLDKALGATGILRPLSPPPQKKWSHFSLVLMDDAEPLNYYIQVNIVATIIRKTRGGSALVGEAGCGGGQIPTPREGASMAEMAINNTTAACASADDPGITNSTGEGPLPCGSFKVGKRGRTLGVPPRLGSVLCLKEKLDACSSRS